MSFEPRLTPKSLTIFWQMIFGNMVLRFHNIFVFNKGDEMTFFCIKVVFVLRESVQMCLNS